MIFKVQGLFSKKYKYLNLFNTIKKIIFLIKLTLIKSLTGCSVFSGNSYDEII